MTLPHTFADLRDLRAARWIRESTAGQLDNFGPDAQRRQQDAAIARHELRDGGIAWTVAHSGWRIARAPEWAEMLARAGRDYDVLVVGYASRFARSLEAHVDARRAMHAAGAVILFADEGILSSDEASWEHWAREVVEAEAYSRRLARRIREGYEAKFRRHADQAGSAPLGFRRGPERPHLLELDASSIGRVVAIFRRYAAGTVSMADLAAESGVKAAALREILANPIYNGWVRRRGELVAASWRLDPPVDDDLWARVAEVRRARYTGGGHPTPRHVHLLAGRLFCAACGARIRATTSTKSRRWLYRRYRHVERCAAWAQTTVAAERLEEPIAEQLAQVRPDAAWLARLRRLAMAPGARPDTTALRRRQLEREMEVLGMAHARRRLSTEAYLEAHTRLSTQLDGLTEPLPDLDPDAALGWVRRLRQAWRQADEGARRDLVAAVYDRVDALPSGELRVRLTPAAYAHGLDLALPEYVLLARPAGAGHTPSTVLVAIAYRRERLAAIRRAG